MVENQNKEILDKISEETKNPNVAVLPRNINNSIQPVLISNADIKKYPILVNAIRTATGGASIYTTPADKDFYLTSVTLTYTADATCDAVLYTVDCNPRGGTINTPVASLRKETTTAGNDHIHVSFPVPILLDRSSIIGHLATFTAGASTFETTISGFLIDTLEK